MADIWEQLRVSSAALERNSQNVGKTFMSQFNAYNKSIGFALGELQEQPQSIQGRDEEIRLLYAVLERPKTPVALLLGQAGTGKTAMVEEFAKQLNSGTYDTKLNYKYFLLSLRLGNLASIGTNKLQSTLASLLDTLKGFETLAQQQLNDPSIRIVLFIDEVHMLVTIFGPGTKIGGDVMKDVLARSPIRVIAATTRREYDSTIAVDKPLAERFKQIELTELPKKIVIRVCLEWWSKIAADCPPLDLDVMEMILDANAMYRSDSAEPRKSLDILEDLVSYCRRTGEPATTDIVTKIFKDRYSISLSFHVNADDVFANVQRRVKGQVFAMYEVRRLLRSMMYQLDPMSNKPLATALFTGVSGSGKSVSEDMLIPTPNGFKKAGDVVIGDQFFDRFGLSTNVSGIFPQGLRQMYRLTFQDGRDLIVDGDHLMAFYTYKQKVKSDLKQYPHGDPPFSVETVKTLLERGVLNDPQPGKKQGRPKFYIPMNHAVQYPERELSVDPYALGALIGDGCLTSGMALAVSSQDDFIPQMIADTLPVPTTPVKQKSNYTWFFRLDQPTNNFHKLFQQKWLFHDFPEFIGSSTYTKRIPEEYKISSIDQRWALIQGLFDTDGTIGEKDGRYTVRFDSVNKELIEDVQEVLFSLGVSSIIHSHDRTHQLGRSLEYRLVVRCDSTTKSRFFRLPRKLERAARAIEFEPMKKQKKKYNFIGITSIEPIGEPVPAVCFMVDNDEHLFQVSRQYVVTHNTETTKAIAEALYPQENVLMNINMPDYKTPEHEPAFRKRLGEHVRHVPNAVILLDEFEKAHESVRDSMLTILDEGLVTFETMNREGNPEVNTISLRNTIVIATTNAGSDAFADIAKFTTTDHTEFNAQLASDADILMKNLRPSLIAQGFKPEMLGRFNRIVPYMALTPSTLLQIAENEIYRIVKRFHDMRGIDIILNPPQDWNPDAYPYHTFDVALFIAFVRASADDPNAGGARAIKREIDTLILDSIIDAIAENPGVTKFKLEISKNSKIYVYGASANEGGVVVSAIE